MGKGQTVYDLRIRKDKLPFPNFTETIASFGNIKHCLLNDKKLSQ